MQLLRYSINDLQLDMQVYNARLEYTQELPKHTVQKSGGKLEMSSSPTRLRLDSYERRASMGFRGVQSQTDYMKQSGREAALEAIANYAQAGNALLNIQKGATIPDAYQSKFIDSGTLGFKTLAPVDISWEEGFLKQEYETARLSFDWKTAQSNNAQFIAGGVEFNITQYSSIEFEYLGEPIYVPKSADPNYSNAT